MVLLFSLATNKPWDIQNRVLFRTIFALGILFHYDSYSSFTHGHSSFSAIYTIEKSIGFFTLVLPEYYYIPVMSNAIYLWVRENCFWRFSDIVPFVICLIIFYAIIQDQAHSIKEKLILSTFQIFPLIMNILGAYSGEYGAVHPSYLCRSDP